MTDIPTLLVEILADLQKECGPERQAVIAMGINEGALKGSVSRVLSPLYRTLISTESM